MLNMAKADLYRIFRSKGMYIFLGLIVLCYAMSIISKTMVGFFNGFDPTGVTEGFKLDMRMLGFSFNYYYLMLIPVSVVLLADFNEKTIKNTLSSVTSKSRYFIFKWLILQCIGILAFLFGNTLFYVFNRIINGVDFSSAASEYFKAVLLQLPTLTAVISVFVFFAFLLRKTALFNVFMLIITEVYSLTIGLLLEFDSTRSIAQEHLMGFDLSYIFQCLAGNSSASYKTRVVIISIVVTAAFFAVGLRTYSRSEPTDQ